MHFSQINNFQPPVFESSVSMSDFLVDGVPSFRELDEEKSKSGYRLVEMMTEKTASNTGRILSARMVWRHDCNSFSFSKAGGVLGVLFPVLDCRKMLEHQVNEMLRWIDLVSEIVVLDGGSTDGTPEYLAEQFAHHPRVRVVRHPRGLWQSWNAGLALMTTDYVHIATAGDTMSRSGVEHILNVARSTDADIVISPPRILSCDGGVPPCTRWVIHEMLERFNVKSPQLMKRNSLLYWTFWYAGGAPAMLGSSASNLYRVKLLQEYPFPTGASTAGDCAWGLLHMHRAKVSFTPNECADFIYHPAEGRPTMSDLRRLMFDYACRGVGLTREEGEFAMRTIQANMEARERARYQMAELRKEKGFFLWFTPSAWKVLIEYLKLNKNAKNVAKYPVHFKAYLCRFIQCGGFRTDV